MKAALCFIISYEHILKKENIWKTWIKENQDILNIYFYYKDFNKIKSQWIRKHCIPNKYIYDTTYYHIIPAYISIMKYAMDHDPENQWFCLLTDSCCPIISPLKFRRIFYTFHAKSFFSWKKAWWNVSFHKRANLRLLKEEYQLANDPWFVIQREDVNVCLQYYVVNHETTKLVCEGGLANESLFAIMLHHANRLHHVINSVSHITDWSRMASPTSPHLFVNANERDIQFIEKSLKNPHALFIRKISSEFPDKILEHYIYAFSEDKPITFLLFMYVSFCSWQKFIYFLTVKILSYIFFNNFCIFMFLPITSLLGKR